jgi:hypothetical protein
MNVMLDYITSTIIFGILTITIARVQQNINATLFLNTQSIIAQANTSQFAREIEWDFLKIGHRTVGQKIFYADSVKLVFKGDLSNTMTQDSVVYSIGDTSQATATFNPRDFPIYRTLNGVPIKKLYGIVAFKLSYIDSAYKPITVPINTPSRCALIRGINVFFRVEYAEPTYTAFDTTWAATSWQKLIFPRNLNNMYY